MEQQSWLTALDLVAKHWGLGTVREQRKNAFRHMGCRGGDHVVSTNEGTFLVDLVLGTVRMEAARRA